MVDWRRTRRQLLGGAVGLALASGAQAQTRSPISQQMAQYQPGPKNGVSCAACTFFRPPAACQVVAGLISPQGWCTLFDLPD